MLATCQDNTAQRHLNFSLHCVPDDNKSVRTGHTIRNQIVRLVVIAKVDILGGDELINFNSVGALQRDRVEFVVFDLEILALRVLIPPSAVLLIDFPAGDLIDKLLPETMAVILVNLMKVRFLG